LSHSLFSKPFWVSYDRKRYTDELAQSCTWTDPNTGHKFDITPLQGSTDYKINYDPTKPNYNMFLNLCTPVSMQACGTGIACCQQWDPTNKNGQASLGLESSLTFSYGAEAGNNNEQGLKVSFSGGSLTTKNIPRNMEIDFICDKSAGVVCS
jgi:hypothetical protein